MDSTNKDRMGQFATFKPIQRIQDTQPIRATCFHPSGQAYVVGTNSKSLKICKYPKRSQINELMSLDGGDIGEPEISFTSLLIHRASVYCTTFNDAGDLLASGSNDQVVHIIKYNDDDHKPQGNEFKLTLHNGTVRDMTFLPHRPLLLSAGGGDNEINLTDCEKMKLKHVYRGHKSTVMSLHCCQDLRDTFVSGSLDGSIKIWDVRCPEPVDKVCNTSQNLTQTCNNYTRQDHSFDSNNNNNDTVAVKQEPQQENLRPTNGVDLSPDRRQERTTVISTNGTINKGASSQRRGVPVGAVRLDPTGRLLVSGHQDGSCMLHDMRAGRHIQTFRAHDGEIRTLNFSPESHYLLTGGYDGKARLHDLQEDLNKPLLSVDVVELEDKIVQTAWHPSDFNFVTTCADGSATLWAMPTTVDWYDESVARDH